MCVATLNEEVYNLVGSIITVIIRMGLLQIWQLNGCIEPVPASFSVYKIKPPPPQQQRDTIP